MRAIAAAVRMLAALVERATLLLAQVQSMLYQLLPALLSPEDLIRSTRGYYDASYRGIAARHPEHAYKWTLEPWEASVAADYFPVRATILVAGSGVGRESIALAQRGFTVLGMDLNLECLQMAQRRAAGTDTPTFFVQGDFDALPVLGGRVDAILLSGVMYSAIPGRTRRQAHLKRFRAILAPHGKIVVNFLVALDAPAQTHPMLDRAAVQLQRWFQINPEYQPGDSCTRGHFMHTFADEGELRDEVTGAGLAILAVNWSEGYAVMA